MKVKYSQKKIKDLVDENHVFASVLYYMGIQYYDYTETTLELVCKQKGLSLTDVVQNLEKVLDAEESENLKLLTLPVDLIVEYLKHAHFLFIKKDLPFLSKLINRLENNDPNFYPVQNDLKDVFPLFVEDFVHHMYEEEDTLFDYIVRLKKYEDRKDNPSLFFFQSNTFSLQKFALEHEVHDDEMKGIRQITNGYAEDLAQDLTTRILFYELKRFEKKLQIHAKIENEILFPKALMLERKVKRTAESLIKWN